MRFIRVLLSYEFHNLLQKFNLMVLTKKIVILLSLSTYFSHIHTAENPRGSWIPSWPQQLFGGLAGQSLGKELGKNFKDGCEIIASGYIQGTTMNHSVAIDPITTNILRDFNQRLQDLRGIKPQARLDITITPTTGKVVSGTGLIVVSACMLSSLAHKYLDRETTPSVITGSVIGACSVATLLAGTALLFSSDARTKKPKARPAVQTRPAFDGGD